MESAALIRTIRTVKLCVLGIESIGSDLRPVASSLIKNHILQIMASLKGILLNHLNRGRYINPL